MSYFHACSEKVDRALDKGNQGARMAVVGFFVLLGIGTTRKPASPPTLVVVVTDPGEHHF
jgi:hypothetical protein